MQLDALLAIIAPQLNYTAMTAGPFNFRRLAPVRPRSLVGRATMNRSIRRSWVHVVIPSFKKISFFGSCGPVIPITSAQTQ